MLSASQEMTRLLLQLGLRRIALLTGSPSYYVNQDRAKGYFDALAELGFVVDGEVTVVSELGGSLILQVKDSRIALDRSMANRIMF